MTEPTDEQTKMVFRFVRNVDRELDRFCAYVQFGLGMIWAAVCVWLFNDSPGDLAITGGAIIAIMYIWYRYRTHGHAKQLKEEWTNDRS